MPSRLRLQCLGIPRLLTPAGEDVPFKVRKHLALLVFLAVEDHQRHRRERLVELFWPEGSERLGRQSLATALSAIRRRLGVPTALEGNNEHVRLVPGHVALDLERLIAGKVAGDGLEPPLEVWGFLEGFELQGLTEFQHWRDRQQARLLPAIQAGLVALADQARRTGDTLALGRLADRLIALNELSEEGVRARMEAAALSGDRISALQAYEAYAQRLDHELRARPTGLIEGIAARLRRRGWDRALDAREPSVRTEHWQGRPFVGRAEEYRRLYEAWERIHRPGPQHVVITGTSGVGKTTLADRFATAISLEGAQVARARGHELDRGIPFAMIGVLLRSLADRPGVAAASPASLAELARIAPEVGSRFQDLPTVPEAAGESARIRFAEAFLDLVTVLVAEQPVVLFIDDVHMADEASLSALHFVMQRLAEAPLMVLLTARPELPEGAVTAPRMLDDAERLGIQAVELEPMSDEETAQLLDALVMPTTRLPTTTERKALVRASGGYPLALELLLTTWQEQGHDLGFLALDAMTVAVDRGPEQTYRRLAENTLKQLPPTQRVMLNLAAILDRRLGELHQYRLVDLSPVQVVAEMTTLASRRVMRDAGQGLEFVHPALRAHTYLSIPAMLRRMLHSGVADDLLGRRRAGEKILGLEVAWHCIRADRVEEGKPFLFLGAREALDQGAPHEVELALRTGLPLLSGTDRVMALLFLAEALQELGRWAESLETLAEPLGAGTPAVREEAAALALFARVRLSPPTPLAAEEVLMEATRMLREVQSPAARVHAAAAGAVACSSLRDPAAASRFGALLDPFLAAATDAAERSHLLLSAAILSAFEGRNDRALALVTEASETAAGLGIRTGLRGRIETGLGAALCATGRYEEAIPHLIEAANVLISIGSGMLARVPYNNLGICHLRLGNYRATLASADKASALDPNPKPNADTLFTHQQAAMAAALLGDHAEAQRHLDAISASYTDSPIAWLTQRALLTAADTYFLLNKKARAVEAAKRATSGQLDTPLTAQLTGPFARWLVQLHKEGVPVPQLSERLEECCGKISALDTVDRAEVLLAAKALRSLSAAEQTVLQDTLTKLPEATYTQLRRLGIGATQ